MDRVAFYRRSKPKSVVLPKKKEEENTNEQKCVTLKFPPNKNKNTHTNSKTD